MIDERINDTVNEYVDFLLSKFEGTDAYEAEKHSLNEAKEFSLQLWTSICYKLSSDTPPSKVKIQHSDMGIVRVTYDLQPFPEMEAIIENDNLLLILYQIAGSSDVKGKVYISMNKHPWKHLDLIFSN